MYVRTLSFASCILNSYWYHKSDRNKKWNRKAFARSRLCFFIGPNAMCNGYMAWLFVIVSMTLNLHRNAPGLACPYRFARNIKSIHRIMLASLQAETLDFWNSDGKSKSSSVPKIYKKNQKPHTKNKCQRYKFILIKVHLSSLVKYNIIHAN